MATINSPVRRWLSTSPFVPYVTYHVRRASWPPKSLAFQIFRELFAAPAKRQGLMLAREQEIKTLSKKEPLKCRRNNDKEQEMSSFPRCLPLSDHLPRHSRVKFGALSPTPNPAAAGTATATIATITNDFVQSFMILSLSRCCAPILLRSPTPGGRRPRRSPRPGRGVGRFCLQRPFSR